MLREYRNTRATTSYPQYYIIDRQTGDVNGNYVLDTVYLIGEKREEGFYENLKIVVEDGRTLQQYTFPLDEKYNRAYNPWLFLGRFTDGCVNQVMVNLPVGGSGALTYYYLFSFLDNEMNILLSPESFTGFSRTMGMEAEYMDDYKVLIQSRTLDQYYLLDLTDREPAYRGILYGRNNKLLKPQKGFFIDMPHLGLARTDGTQPYKLQAQNAIAGTSHADRLGYTLTYWKYRPDTKSWILCPEIFFVLL